MKDDGRKIISSIPVCSGEFEKVQPTYCNKGGHHNVDNKRGFIDIRLKYD